MQQNIYASSSKNVEDNERLFVVQHVMKSVAKNTTKGGDALWYVDSSASNHITNHGEWFKEMKKPERPGYVETSDDTTHSIAHIGDVSLSMQDGKVKCLTNVLHVP